MGADFLDDSTVEKMVSVLGGVDFEGSTNIKNAVLREFMVKFGNMGGVQKTVTAVSFNSGADADHLDPPNITTKKFGLVAFHGRHAFHCDHDMFRYHKGVNGGGGCAVTYGFVGRMASMLNERDHEDDPHYRARHDGGVFYADAVLADFVTVFGTRLRGRETVTACVLIQF